MLRGRFGDTTGRPYFDARVVLPRLEAKENVSFIFDTGADSSVLMPLDARRLGIDLSKLDEAGTATGIGGTQKRFIEPAIVIFADDNLLYAYRIQIGIISPSPETMTVPSLLGRDIIDRWRVTYDKPGNTLSAHVVSATARIPVRAANRDE